MANDKQDAGKPDASSTAQQVSKDITRKPPQHTRHDQHGQQQVEGGGATQGLGKAARHEAEKKLSHGHKVSSPSSAK